MDGVGAMSVLRGPADICGQVISWIPMDVVAHTVSDIVLGAHDLPLVNIVHPRPVKPEAVLSVVSDDAGGGLGFVPSAISLTNG